MPESNNFFDLTQPQMNIWGGQVLNPDKPLYNMVMAFHFHGAIEVDRFRNSFQQLTDQNDVLRLAINIENGLPRQYFHAKVADKLEYIDLSNDDSSIKLFEQYIEKDKGRIFDSDELLYHTVLFKFSEDHFIWYINHHHLMTDGVTILLLYDRLHEIYVSEASSKDYKMFTYQKVSEQLSHNLPKETSGYWEQLKDSVTPPPALYGVSSSNSSGLPRSPSSG